jgi:hypothetical protein
VDILDNGMGVSNLLVFFRGRYSEIFYELLRIYSSFNFGEVSSFDNKQRQKYSPIKYFDNQTPEVIYGQANLSSNFLINSY